MPGPLEGVRVLSFCRALAGPYATMLLADLGADVIKIESPRGDLARAVGPFVEGISSYFLSVNRGKKSITLNLRHERARRIALELAGDVDILIENYRPGVMADMGLDYETIRDINPKIIYASVSGFGQNGPYANKPAFDMIAQGMGGVLSITGEPDGPPVRVGYSIGDMGSALFSVIAILAALHECGRSGNGQWVDVSMLDSQVALCENACARYFATGEIPGPLGTRHPMFTPFQVFPTKDGAIILIAFKDDDWTTFCKVAGKEEWIGSEQYYSFQERLENYSRFSMDMNELMRSRSTREWMEVLDAHGVMCGPVNNIEDVVNDPHILERDMIREVEDSRGLKFRIVGTPMKFSRTPCAIRKAGPELGEHTDEVLTELQGLSEDELKRLREDEVIE